MQVENKASVYRKTRYKLRTQHPLICFPWGNLELWRGHELVSSSRDRSFVHYKFNKKDFICPATNLRNWEAHAAYLAEQREGNKEEALNDKMGGNSLFDDEVEDEQETEMKALSIVLDGK